MTLVTALPHSSSKMKTGRSPSKTTNSAVWTKSHFMMPLWNLLPNLTGRDAIMEPTSKSYWQRRGNMSASNISTIDWELIGKAFTNLTTAKKCRVTKHASGHFGCGKMMQIWKVQDHAECPRCPKQDEDPPHILNCPSLSATLHWEKALTVLEVWMTAHHTMPELMTALLRCLHEWKHPNPSRRFVRAAITMRYGLWAAILEQDDIGWYNFLMRRASVWWRDVQHRYYEWLQRRNTAKAWLQALIIRKSGKCLGTCGIIRMRSVRLLLLLPQCGRRKI
jgi:hypothetical protein